MTFEELNGLLKHIFKFHNFGEYKGKKIKYVIPSINMRNAKIFHIRINGIFEGGRKDFWLRNGDLLDQINNWLAG